VRYTCPSGHEFEVPLVDGVEVPTRWECRRHGTESDVIDDVSSQQREQVKPPRTHWDMVLERRSIPELEALLQERLATLAACRAGLAST
jgi:hypothetical protein